MNSSAVSPHMLYFPLQLVSNEYKTELLRNEIMGPTFEYIYRSQTIDNPQVYFSLNMSGFKLNIADADVSTDSVFKLTDSRLVARLVHAVLTDTCTTELLDSIKFANACNRFIDPTKPIELNLCIFPVQYLDDETLDAFCRVMYANLGSTHLVEFKSKIRKHTYAYIHRSSLGPTSLGHQDYIMYANEIVVTKSSADLITSLALLGMEDMEIKAALIENHNKELEVYTSNA